MSGIGIVDIAVTVEIDLSGTPYGGTPDFTDVTADVLTAQGVIDITWGQQDWSGDIGPATCEFTLDNVDGKYTPGLTSSPYYPYVRKRARCRVLCDVTVDAAGLTFTDLGDGTYSVDGPAGWYYDVGNGTFLLLRGGMVDNGNGTYTYTGDPVTTTVYLFDGLIDEWSTSFENGVYSLTAVSATDMLGRFGSVPLRNMLVEEIGLDLPVSNGAFYPFDDQGPTLGDLTGTRPTLAVTVGSGSPDIAYQNVTGCADETISGVGLGGYFSYIPCDFGMSGGAAAELFFTTTFTGVSCILLGDVFDAVNIEIDANGYVTDGTVTGPFVADGLVHQVVAIQGDGWYLDGTKIGTASLDTAVTSIGFNFVGTVWCFGWYFTPPSLARFAEHLECARTGFAGESTDAHITRLLSYRTNFGAVLDAGYGTVGSHATDSISLQQALYDTAEAEGGVVFVDGQGRVVFRNRGHLFSPVPSLVLDASAGEVDSTTTFTDSTQFLVNEATVTASTGAVQRYRDDTSWDADGESAQDYQLIVDTDAQALARARWLVQVGTQEQTSATQLDVDLFTMTEAATVLAVLQAQPLDVVKLLNLPAATPTVDEFMIQGGSLSIGVSEFTASMFTTVIPAGDAY